MGHNDAADLLEETLDEEKAADEKLTALPRAASDQGAVADPDERESVTVGAGAGQKGASRRRLTSLALTWGRAMVASGKSGMRQSRQAGAGLQPRRTMRAHRNAPLRPG